MADEIVSGTQGVSKEDGSTEDVTKVAKEEGQETKLGPDGKPLVVVEVPKDKLSSKIANLKRVERELQNEKQSMKAERESLKADKEALETFRKIKAEAKKNPQKALDLIDVSFEELADWHYLGKQTEDLKFKEVNDKLTAFEEKEALKLSDAKSKADQEEIDLQVKNWKQSVKTLIEEEKEKYEFCSINSEEDSEDAIDLAMKFTESYYRETIDPDTGEGQFLPQEVALDWVEEYYEKQAKKLGKAKKYQPTTSSASGDTVKDNKDVVNKTSRTLSNVMDANSPSSTDDSKLSREEKRKRAAAALR